jgi:hypothetical protein
MKSTTKIGLGFLTIFMLGYQPVRHAYNAVLKHQEVQASKLYAKPDATLTRNSSVSVDRGASLNDYLMDTALYPLELDAFLYADFAVLQYNDTVESYFQVLRPDLADIRTALYNGGVIDLINCYGKDISKDTLDDQSYLLLGNIVLKNQIRKRKEEILASLKK